jgi:hypothetical protein
MQMATLTVKGIGTVNIHFNGDYFLDDGNNVFLQRHPTTRQWFLMIRPGPWADAVKLDEYNARIATDAIDYGFDSAWREYQILIVDIYNSVY